MARDICDIAYRTHGLNFLPFSGGRCGCRTRTNRNLRHHCLLPVAPFTGLRCGEVLDLEWSEADLNRKTFRPPILRLGRERYRPTVRPVTSSQDMKQANQACLSSSARPGKEVGTGQAMGENPQAGEHRRHCQHPLSAPHLCVLGREGWMSLVQTSALLCHKSSQTTLRYADHHTEAVREYSQKTANFIAAQ